MLSWLEAALQKVMFLDESGVHWHQIGSDYPVFVLGGVVTPLSYAKTEVEERLAELRRKHFGDTSVILHTAEIIRNKGPFECLKDASRRAAFFQDLNQMMRDLEYSVIACAIKMDEYVARYGDECLDPYECCLGVLVERFCQELSEADKGSWIVAECRRPDLDRQLLGVWETVVKHGTGCVSGKDVSERIAGLLYREKSQNIGGLQLADLVVSPIGRHVIGKSVREDFEIVRSKLRRLDGEYLGHGLVILP